MNFVSNMKTFFKNIGYDKLFLTFMPLICAFYLTKDVFKVNYLNGVLLIIAILYFQISVQIFDDFMDWVLGQTQKRNELEQLGIRGNFEKCKYIYMDKRIEYLNSSNTNLSLHFTVQILFPFSLATLNTSAR